MGAADTEPPDKKVDKDDILDVFHRRPGLPPVDGGDDARVGKWELSSSEVAELVNQQLDGEGISRQAIHRRLERMEEVVKVKHGRTVTWRLASDRLTIQSRGNDNSGGGGGPGVREIDKESSNDAKKSDDGEINGNTDKEAEAYVAGLKRAVNRYGKFGSVSVPLLMILAAIGYTGWYALQWVNDDDPQTLRVTVAIFTVLSVTSLPFVIQFEYAVFAVLAYLLVFFSIGPAVSLVAGRYVVKKLGWVGGETA